jgi:hypothetical protein
LAIGQINAYVGANVEIAQQNLDSLLARNRAGHRFGQRLREAD